MESLAKTLLILAALIMLLGCGDKFELDKKEPLVSSAELASYLSEDENLSEDDKKSLSKENISSKIIAKFDKNGNEELDKEELGAFLESLKKMKKKRGKGYDKNKFIACYDINGDGKITLEEKESLDSDEKEKENFKSCIKAIKESKKEYYENKK